LGTNRVLESIRTKKEQVKGRAPPPGHAVHRGEHRYAKHAANGSARAERDFKFTLQATNKIGGISEEVAKFFSDVLLARQRDFGSDPCGAGLGDEPSDTIRSGLSRRSSKSEGGRRGGLGGFFDEGAGHDLESQKDIFDK
jgi:hypothetical protein